MWFLLQFKGREADLRLDLCEKPEFDGWRWVDFWYPMEHVVTFKRGVYARALHHLAPLARAVAGMQAVPQVAELPGEVERPLRRPRRRSR